MAVAGKARGGEDTMTVTGSTDYHRGARPPAGDAAIVP